MPARCWFQSLLGLPFFRYITPRSFAALLLNRYLPHIILSTTRIFPLLPLSATLSPNVSRDAPCILQLPPFQGSKLHHLVWVFSDTETVNSQEYQGGFISNSAGWDTSNHRAILKVTAIASGLGPDISLKVNRCSRHSRRMNKVPVDTVHERGSSIQ